MPVITMPIDCPGGAYGKCEVVWPIPQEWQGKTALIGIAAASRYPAGRNALLRSRGGMDVAKLKEGIWSAGLSLLELATAGPLSAFLTAMPTRLKIALPEGVAASGPEAPAMFTEILWQPNAGGITSRRLLLPA